MARLIVAFAKLVTLPLNPVRRRDATAIARDLLAPTHSVETDRGRLVFDTSSRWSCRRAWDFRTHEPDTLEWVDEFPEDACFWDIGANVGTFSLYAALGPRVRVLAFEPANGSFAVLNRNIELNDMPDRIVAYCIAFSDATKLDTLNMASTQAGQSMHGFATEVNVYDEIIRTKYRQGCVGFSVDDFVSSFSPPLPTHVKIDVDGLEAAILQGGRDTFSSPSVRSMLVEVVGHSARREEIMALMREFRFVDRLGASPESRNVIFDRSPA